MALRQITKFVVPFDEIPKELTDNHWLTKHHKDAYVEVHIDDEEADPISDWLLDNYPELAHEEESFLIHMGY